MSVQSAGLCRHLRCCGPLVVAVVAMKCIAVGTRDWLIHDFRQELRYQACGLSKNVVIDLAQRDDK
jgi:hypothetical protein